MRKLNSLKLLLSALLLVIGCNVWGMPSNYMVSSTPLTSVANGDLVAWGTSSSNLVYVIESDWGRTNSTKSDWIVFTVETATDGFYLKYTDGSTTKYVYSSAAKKISVDATNKTLFTIATKDKNNANLVYNSTAGYYTYNNSGIRPYTSNCYTEAHLYAVTPVNPYTVTFNVGSNGSFASSETFDAGTTNQRTEASAGEGVALPNVTANANYAFKGWSTSNPATANTLVSAGEDGNYHPSANTPLYAYYVATYTLTITQPAAGGTLTVKNGATTLATGATVEVGTNLTCEVTNIPEGKRFSRFYAKWDNDESKYKQSNPATFDNIATEGITACEIYVTYQDLPKFTINYMVNGMNTNPQEDVWENTALVFPTVNDIAGKVFRGWIEDEPIDGTTDIEPTWVSTEGLTAKANKTYYAVFATEKEVPATTYSKITSMENLTDNDYVIAYDYNGGTQIAMGNTINTSNYISATNLSLSNGKYANPNADYIWSIKEVVDGDNTYYTLYNADANKYAKATSSGVSLVDDAYNFTITWDNTNKVFRIKSTTDATYYLHGYVSGSSYDFRSSTSGNGDRYHLHLYKNESTISYSDYCTTIAYTLTTADNDFYSLYLPFDAEIPDNVDVYTGELDENETTLTLHEVTGTIPAETAVLVKSPSTTGDFVFKYASETQDPLTNNSLKGVLVDTKYDDLAEDGKTLLTLNTREHVVGFYLPKEGATTLKANRAYLLVTTPKTPAPVRIVMPNDVATAIENNSEAVKANKTLIDGRLFILRDGNMFDLNGRLVK